MVPSVIPKKAIMLLIFVSVIGLVLLFVPDLEAWLYTQFASEMSRQFIATGSSIVKILLGMAIIIAVVRFFANLILRTALRNTFQGEVGSLLKTVISVVIYIVSFFIIFQQQFPGVPLAPLFTGSTIIGIVVGLALQDTLGNLFAGLALQADQSFQVGDVIVVSNRAEGVVESVSWRGVKIRTFQNKLVIISNAVLGRETIEVCPKDNLNAKAVFFNTHYSASPAKTIQVVREAVRHIENVSPKMRPNVRIRSLADSGIEWEVKYWLIDYKLQHDTDALIRQRIWYVFQREHIEFAYPTRTIHVKDKPVDIAPEEAFNSIAEKLHNVMIFNPLCEEEIIKLANVSTTRIYAPGEAVVRIGQEGNSMYVILRGSVKVQIPEKEYQKTVGTLGENDFFGEMSLLTGQPRTANVIAVEESEVLRIDKSGLRPILENNPALVESVSDLIEERRTQLTADTPADEETQTETRKGVMRSIRTFFGLK
ncbi:hypothetical protein BH10ACI3_BH10ACI3_28570 [soil metagenome]